MSPLNTIVILATLIGSSAFILRDIRELRKTVQIIEAAEDGMACECETTGCGCCLPAIPHGCMNMTFGEGMSTPSFEVDFRSDERSEIVRQSLDSNSTSSGVCLPIVPDNLEACASLYDLRLDIQGASVCVRFDITVTFWKFNDTVAFDGACLDFSLPSLVKED